MKVYMLSGKNWEGDSQNLGVYKDFDAAKAEGLFQEENDFRDYIVDLKNEEIELALEKDYIKEREDRKQEEWRQYSTRLGKVMELWRLFTRDETIECYKIEAMELK